MSLNTIDATLTVGNGEAGFDIAIPELDLPPSSCTAIIGQSGAGKTSILEFLSLMRTPSSVTSLAISGVEVRALAMQEDISARAEFRARHIMYVVQSGGVLPFLSVQENALAGLRASGETADSRAMIRLKEGAKQLGMTKVLDKKRHQLSGGERRRVGLLRALVSPRPVVVIDEPTNALDAESADRAVEALRLLAEYRGSAVLVVTHDERRIREAGFRMFELRVRDDGSHRKLVASEG